MSEPDVDNGALDAEVETCQASWGNSRSRAAASSCFETSAMDT